MVVDFESRLERLTESASPEDLIPAATERLRRGAIDETLRGMFAPHVMVHAMEACCAYWKPHRYRPLTEDHLNAIIHMIGTFEDPALLFSITPDADLLDFFLYVHRTQFEQQGDLWWIPVGRAVMLYGSPSDIPNAWTSFISRYGLTPREWIQLSFLGHAATIGMKAKFTHLYVRDIPRLGISQESVDAFFRAVTTTPQQISITYREVRARHEVGYRYPPLTWLQRRPAVSSRPLIKLAHGYIAPSDAHTAKLMGNILVRYMTDDDSPAVREDLTRQYERYIEGAIRHNLPGVRVWLASDLKSTDGLSCDIAIDLPDCIMLLECKYVSLDQNVATRLSVLKSSAMSQVVKGFRQLLETSHRINEGGYKTIGLLPSKPLVAVVCAPGELPSFNHPAIWEHAQENRHLRELLRKGMPVVFRPQVLHAFAFEDHLIATRDGLLTVLEHFESLKDRVPLELAHWERDLHRLVADAKPKDIQFWDAPAKAAMAELRA